MKKILKKFFGAKHSTTEKSVDVLHMSDSELENQFANNNVDFIIKYIKNGGDINRLIKVYRKGEYINSHEYETIEVYVFPLDLITNAEIRNFLRRHGAISYAECSPEEQDNYREEWKRRAQEEEKHLSAEICRKIERFERFRK
ncbi:MAG: hypothetical protein E7019_06005 [Alphaproteobacteria bacterium]|nr:hypothetical protein [Alphaproteobacteria bacterium]